MRCPLWLILTMPLLSLGLVSVVPAAEGSARAGEITLAKAQKRPTRKTSNRKAPRSVKKKPVSGPFNAERARANALMNKGRHAEALRIWKRLHAQRPDDLAVRVGLGYAYYYTGDSVQALRHLEPAAQLFQRAGVSVPELHLVVAMGTLTVARQLHVHNMQSAGVGREASAANLRAATDHRLRASDAFNLYLADETDVRDLISVGEGLLGAGEIFWAMRVHRRLMQLDPIRGLNFSDRLEAVKANFDLKQIPVEDWPLGIDPHDKEYQRMIEEVIKNSQSETPEGGE